MADFLIDQNGYVQGQQPPILLADMLTKKLKIEEEYRYTDIDIKTKHTLPNRPNIASAISRAPAPVIICPGTINSLAIRFLSFISNTSALYRSLVKNGGNISDYMGKIIDVEMPPMAAIPTTLKHSLSTLSSAWRLTGRVPHGTALRSGGSCRGSG